MTTRVRKALPTDAAPLLDLIRQHAAFEQAAADLGRDDIAFILDAPEPPTRLIVAEDGGGLTGYAALTFDYSLWSAACYAHLDCLFVRADARARGVGKLLLDHACRLAEQAGAQRVEWQTPAWNAGAIRFYEREGGIGQAKMRFSRSLSVQPAGSAIAFAMGYPDFVDGGAALPRGCRSKPPTDPSRGPLASNIR